MKLREGREGKGEGEGERGGGEATLIVCAHDHLAFNWSSFAVVFVYFHRLNS